jgi:hypothetical protein
MSDEQRHVGKNVRYVSKLYINTASCVALLSYRPESKDDINRGSRAIIFYRILAVIAQHSGSWFRHNINLGLGVDGQVGSWR